MLLRDDLDADAGHDHERGGADLCAPSFASGGSAVDVVDEPGDEEDRAAAEDAAELAARRDDAASRRAIADRGEQPREDADPAEERRRLRVPAVRPRRGDDVARRRRVQERPRSSAGSRGSRERRAAGGDRHARKRNQALLSRCLGTDCPLALAAGC